jgi:hypothetical protein
MVASAHDVEVISDFDYIYDLIQGWTRTTGSEISIYEQIEFVLRIGKYVDT